MPSPALISQMNTTLQHRGPDDEGFFVNDEVQLAMRRLSIIDLHTGHQPLSNEDGSLWLVFNGEIYNYQELRAQLIKAGHQFITASDSEVILHAYEQYGEAFLDYLNGMFAFAIWDVPQQRLLLARDRLGIKPLFYWTDGADIVFGSEMKALLRHPGVPREIDPAALDQLLTLEYIPSPATILRDVRKLSAGQYLIFERGMLQVRTYWDVRYQEVPADPAACAEALQALLQDAVKLHMVSDVPVGAFLSGGMDSSTVVALMSAQSQQVQTFSIGFQDITYNELPYARAIAEKFGTRHQEAFLKPDILALVMQLVAHLDEPLGDFSIFPTYLVSALARESVKVVLSGDGGDEIFGGYDAYVAQQAYGLYGRLPSGLRNRALPGLMAKVPPQRAKKGLVNKAKRFVEGASMDPQLQHTRWMLFMSEAEKEALYLPELRAQVDPQAVPALLKGWFQRASHRDPLAQQQYVDVKTYLVDNILTKVDRMSMAASIEARVPLLDYRVVEFALSLPPELKLQRGQTKLILKQAMRHTLPEQILRRPKQGFSIPLKNWLGETLRPLMLDVLSEHSIRQGGYFDAHTVQRWIGEHLNGQVNHSHRLWALMMFQLWQQQMAEIAHA